MSNARVSHSVTCCHRLPAALAAAGFESGLALDKAIDNLFRAVLFQQHVYNTRAAASCLFSGCSFLVRPGKCDNLMEKGPRAHRARAGDGRGATWLLASWRWFTLPPPIPSLPPSPLISLSL